jgi:toxin ParE1/3/4
LGRYTVRTWGRVQALQYIDELEKFCQMLAEKPLMGRRCNEISFGLRRLECGKHVVFYRRERGGVLIVRILHQRMLPAGYIDKELDKEK